ncbi:DUF6165 family protein [Sphingomonas rubra]|uniref:Uncharacterized protein n=1 Tax=Sphingomonas rubra TaxID=634430 RepID=A0A1I5PMU7_9SPHN|nr:DUF6165 family protein [Sphingomonas rubra]SFP35452.1 hypothetical protein SAMN04488241_101119 [Sphingomonas rubra]
MTGQTTPTIPVSWGELLDKLTILQLKRDRIAATDARANVAREHDLLHRIGAPVLADERVAALFDELAAVNAALWDIEDAIRAEDAAGRFGQAFIDLARSVYRTNDQRAAIKRRIDVMLGSTLVEEKSYWSAT